MSEDCPAQGQFDVWDEVWIMETDEALDEIDATAPDEDGAR